MTKEEKIYYTPKQELANVLSHGIGILFCWIALPILYSLAAQKSVSDFTWLTIVVYGVSLMLVYINSTVYHALVNKQTKAVFQKLDHISIYLLIAGTTSYFVYHYAPKNTALIFIGVQWLLVLGGIIFKIFLTGKFKYLSTFIYLALGLMVVVIIRPMYANLTANVLFWIVSGGFCYVGGTYFYLSKRYYYQHAIWHLFVLGGSISHYIAMLYSLRYLYP